MGNENPDAYIPRRTHRMTSGDDFMPYGWCGGCETCDMMYCPDVCLACSYTRKGYPKPDPVTYCEKTFKPKGKSLKPRPILHKGRKHPRNARFASRKGHVGRSIAVNHHSPASRSAVRASDLDNLLRGF